MRLDPLQTGSPFAPGYTPPIVAELVPIRQPGYVVFLCVASILLSVVAMGGAAVVGLAREFHGRYDPRSISRARESVQDIVDRGELVDKRYLWITKPLNLLQGVIGIVMIIGATFTLQKRRPGDLLLRGCFAATLALSLFHMLPFVFQMAEVQSVAADLHAKAQQLTGQEAALASQHGNLLAARSSAALMLGCTWLLLKLGLLGHGFVYLGQRDVQATMH